MSAASVTQCPQCSTLFKVVEDQLRVSQGWVRCGQCHEVFDAQRQLLPEVALQSLNLSSAAEATPRSPQAVTQPAESSAPVLPAALVAASDSPVELAAELDVSIGPESDFSAPTLPAVLTAADELATQPGELLPLEQALPEGAAGAVLDAMPAPAVSNGRPPLPMLPMPDPLAAAAMPRVSFIQSAAATPSRRAVAAWSLVAVALLVALAAQWARAQRDVLAAHHPALRPALARLCEWTGCEIGPLRDIDQIVIETSALQPMTDGRYRVNLTLRNNALVGLAMPSVELSLQDRQEEVVLRKVLAPQDLRLLGAELAAGAEASGSAVLSVRAPSANEAPVRVLGYRVVAFYP